MADQENKDFSEDIADQNFEQNGEAENGGGDAAENGQESQEESRILVSQFFMIDNMYAYLGSVNWTVKPYDWLLSLNYCEKSTSSSSPSCFVTTQALEVESITSDQ